MSVGSSSGALGKYLALFAAAEVFIYVFMELVTKIDSVQRVIFKKAQLRDYIVFIVLFGLFSIFGTYIGIQGEYGSISNIRDLAPMVAGLVGGPHVGVAVGLIGGTHRLFLGGDSAIPCAIATVLAGLLAGAIYHFNKGRLPGIFPAMVFAAAFELFHGILGLIMVQPFSEAFDIFMTTIPSMIIANSLGIGISVIIIHSRIEFHRIMNPEKG
jgi:phosphoserine phosphatase RsbU/P